MQEGDGDDVIWWSNYIIRC